MEATNLDEEIKRLVERWNRSILDKDASAAELRHDGYRADLPDGGVLTREEELALIASPNQTVESIRTRNLEVRREADGVTAVFENLIEGEFLGKRVNALYKYTITFGEKGGVWRARRSSLAVEAGAAGGPPGGRWPGASTPGPTFGPGNLVPRALKSWARGKVRSLAAESSPTFPELAYLPYRPGLDFALPPDPGRGADARDSEPPVPPGELWLGYNYPAHGAEHVGKMLEIVYASDFSFKKGDRILGGERRPGSRALTRARANW